jgi:hypothetical protein
MKHTFNAALSVGIIAIVSGLVAAEPNPTAAISWPGQGGQADENGYSALDQIDNTNIQKLDLAWSLASSRRSHFNFRGHTPCGERREIIDLADRVLLNRTICPPVGGTSGAKNLIKRPIV